jgi:hypothetical protein
MKWDEFNRWFNRGFWRAFTNCNFPISLPKTPKQREAIVRSVFDSIVSARYAASIPETGIVINKGNGVGIVDFLF